MIFPGDRLSIAEGLIKQNTKVEILFEKEIIFAVNMFVFCKEEFCSQLTQNILENSISYLRIWYDILYHPQNQLKSFDSRQIGRFCGRYKLS